MKGHFTPHTEETKRKISLAKLGKSSPRKGVKLSKEIIEKMIETRKRNGKPHWNKGGKAPWAVGNKNWLGHIPWNKGKKGVMPVPWNKGKNLSKEIKEKLSIAHKGQKSWNKGKKCSIETIEKIRKSKIGKYRGKDSPHWKGGITPIHNKIRGSLEYKLWSDSVLNRDNNCCQKCGENRVSKLVAHHILNFSVHVELRFAIDNGITFCRFCHKTFHKRYTVRNNNYEQITQFLL